MSDEETRRQVLKKAAFVAPIVLSLVAEPSFASTASGRHETHHQRGEDYDKDEKYEREDGKH